MVRHWGTSQSYLCGDKRKAVTATPRGVPLTKGSGGVNSMLVVDAGLRVCIVVLIVDISDAAAVSAVRIPFTTSSNFAPA